MRSLHLFAGAGGGLLADRILGHTPVGAVELDPYCCAVLRARAADGWFPGLRVHELDIRDFDPREYAGRVDLVAGGFPCQDISAAGSGAGITGARSGLWSEFARVLGVVRPRYAFIENSPMLTLRGLDVVLADLAALGFDAEWAVISAADAGAPHRRERIWILAHHPGDGRRTGRAGRSDSGDTRQPEQSLQTVADTNQPRSQGRGGLVQASTGQKKDIGGGYDASGCGGYVANPNRMRQLQPQGGECDQRGWIGDGGGEIRDSASQGLSHGSAKPIHRSRKDAEPQRSDWWTTEPGMGRVAARVAHRVHRLKALGNGQVPQQAALAWTILSRGL
jgi:DNA (cytosine-5)-methyltransferase 1